jgi:hypothetical protein
MRHTESRMASFALSIGLPACHAHLPRRQTAHPLPLQTSDHDPRTSFFSNNHKTLLNRYDEENGTSTKLPVIFPRF